ncbi:hypothetical protein WDW37_21480 [Bdellovibrionota bacterium FG-1]
MNRDKETTSTADGIYGATATHVMENVALKDAAKPWQTDRNIFEWYENSLPAQMPSVHVIDWGAGVGRFVPFFEARGVQKITLIEPSHASFTALNARLATRPNVELIHDGLGVAVSRTSPVQSTIHVCTFVVNCVENLSTAFGALARAILPGERLFVVTNVFAPKTTVDSIKDSQCESAVPINIAAQPSPDLRPPTTPVFSNEIIGSGEVLKDSVHTLAEYAELWRTEGTHWNTKSAKLMLPDGFRHKVLPGEDFGDYRFAVLVMELERL